MSVASENNAVTFTLSTNCVSKLPEVKIISIFKREHYFCQHSMSIFLEIRKRKVPSLRNLKSILRNILRHRLLKFQKIRKLKDLKSLDMIVKF